MLSLSVRVPSAARVAFSLLNEARDTRRPFSIGDIATSKLSPVAMSVSRGGGKSDIGKKAPSAVRAGKLSLVF